MYPVSKGAALLSPPDVAETERRHRFEEPYAAHRVPVLGYALRRTDNTDDAADVLAETFLTAWRRLDDVPAGDQTRLWLYGTARRVLANYRRGERRRLALADRLKAELAVSYRQPDHSGGVSEIPAASGRSGGFARRSDAWPALSGQNCRSCASDAGEAWRNSAAVAGTTGLSVLHRGPAQRSRRLA